MNLRQLEIFVAIAEAGSFSRGAEASLLSQSTASQHIAALEGEVGLRLLDRSGRGARPTAAGELLLVQARRVLAEVDSLRQAMLGLQGLEAALLTIGASNIPATYLLPRVLPRLAARHPGITLTVVAGDSREILNHLAGGRIELAIVGSRFDDGNCDFTPLGHDRLVLIVGPQHPWRQLKSLPLDELATVPFIVRESGSGSQGAVAQALRAAGFEPQRLRVVARFGSNEAIKEAVSSGCGGAFVSELSVQREVARGELATVAVAGLAIRRQFWLATTSGRSLSPAAQAFIPFLAPAEAADMALPGKIN